MKIQALVALTLAALVSTPVMADEFWVCTETSAEYPAGPNPMTFYRNEKVLIQIEESLFGGDVVIYRDYRIGQGVKISATHVNADDYKAGVNGHREFSLNKYTGEGFFHSWLPTRDGLDGEHVFTGRFEGCKQK